MNFEYTKNLSKASPINDIAGGENVKEKILGKKILEKVYKCKKEGGKKIK